MAIGWSNRTGTRRWAVSSNALAGSLAEPGGWGRFGFYTSGQLFLEEYYTLAVIGKAGIGTPHMDGNTRLCTATAAAALKESFGSDGQPGSYADVDHCDAIALYRPQCRGNAGRALDAHVGSPTGRPSAGDARGRPAATPVTREADVHLAIRGGTNLALMNALIHLLLDEGWYDARTSTSTRLASKTSSVSCRLVAGACRGGMRRGRRAHPCAGRRNHRHERTVVVDGLCRECTSRCRLLPQPSRSTTSISYGA